VYKIAWLILDQLGGEFRGFRKRNSGSGAHWYRADIDTFGWLGDYNAIAIDGYGLVHIAYDGEDALWHARFQAGKTDAVLLP